MFLILGRPIAVDWAVPKDKYDSSAKGGNTNEEADESNSGDSKENNPDQINGDDGEDKDDDCDDVKDEVEDKDDGEDDDDDNEDEDDSDEEDEDDSNEEDEDEETVEPRKKKKLYDSKDAELWKGDQSNEKPSDVNEGKTVFVRNLDFSTTQDSFKHYMEQYGEVHYALLCMDKLMERPKGTGFVKFRV